MSAETYITPALVTEHALYPSCTRYSTLVYPVRSGRFRAVALVVGVMAITAGGLSLVLLRSSLGLHDVEWSPGASPAAPVLSPAPQHSFIWVGTNAGRGQFSEAELSALAADYSVVVIAKFHAGFNVELHHEAARRLVELGGLRVFPYFSMKYWFDKNDWGVDIDPKWLLRDNRGELVRRDEIRGEEGEESNGESTYVDLTNPDYRKWALEVLRSWLARAPYAGIAFDAAVPIAQGGSAEKWMELLGPSRIESYNDGMRALLAAAKDLVGPDRSIVYNGIAPNPFLKGADRNMGFLSIADAALNERFCLDVKGRPHFLDQDLDLLQDQAGVHEIFVRTQFRDSFDQSQRERLERFCFGMFMLTWVPGSSYFHMGTNYTTDQLADRPSSVDVALGAPASDFVRAGSVARRDFNGGSVIVNLGETPAEITLPTSLGEVRGRQVVAWHSAGATVTVGAVDAMFLVH